jgi:hypothetical protein
VDDLNNEAAKSGEMNQRRGLIKDAVLVNQTTMAATATPPA